MPRVFLRASIAGGAAVVLIVACVPGYTFDGASADAGADGPRSDATAGVDASLASLDAGADSSVPIDAAPAPEAGPNGCLGSHGSSMVRFDTNLAGTGPASFCIDQYEATNADFNAYLVDPNAQFAAPPVCNPERDNLAMRPQPYYGHDGLPVVQVSFCDAWSYCLWAGKRLCSAVGGADAGARAQDDDMISNEWDYACRNGIRVTDFPYGSAYEGGVCNVLDPDAGVNGIMTPPGAYADCHGLDGNYALIFDMSGNAAEMDDWATDYTNSTDAAGVTVHTRGGAFDYSFLRACSDRFGHAVLDSFGDVGFRCCSDVAP